MRGREREIDGGSFVVGEETHMEKVNYKRNVGGWLQVTEVNKYID